MLRVLLPANLWSISRNLHRYGWKRTSKLVKFGNFLLYKCLLPAEADVGANIQLVHYALGVVIHPNVVIGKNVMIYHQVTLAPETWVGSEHYIVIEDDVILGAGSTVVGRINQSLRIGRGAMIGAGAVVTGDVAAGDVVAGVPARSIARQPPTAPPG